MNYNRSRGDLRTQLHRNRNRQMNRGNYNFNSCYEDDGNGGMECNNNQNQSGFWQNMGDHNQSGFDDNAGDWGCNNNNLGSRRNGSFPMGNINVRVNNCQNNNGGGRMISFDGPQQMEMNNMGFNNNNNPPMGTPFCNPDDRFHYPEPQIPMNNTPRCCPDDRFNYPEPQVPVPIINTPRCCPEERFNYPEPQVPIINTPLCCPNERFNYPEPQVGGINNIGFVNNNLVGTPQCPPNDRFNYAEPSIPNNPVGDEGGIFSRRRYDGNNCAPATTTTTPQRPFQDNEFALVYDYNHKQNRIPANSPSRRQMAKEKESNNRVLVAPQNPPRVPPRDPRIEKLLNNEKQLNIKAEKAVPCENATTKPSTACSHPKPDVFIKPEPVGADATSAASSSRSTGGGGGETAAAAPKKIDPLQLDRVEREKYEKAKLGKSINPSKGERAVDCIRAVPRPPKDPELESEICVVIEKLKVPVITTPANFTNYKIPRATTKDDSVTEAETTMEPISSSSSGKVKISTISSKTVTSSSSESTKAKEMPIAVKTTSGDKEKDTLANKLVVKSSKPTNKPAETAAAVTSTKTIKSTENIVRITEKETKFGQAINATVELTSKTSIKTTKEANTLRKSIESVRSRKSIIKGRFKNLFDSDSDCGTPTPPPKVLSKVVVIKSTNEERPRNRERRDSTIAVEKKHATSSSVSETKSKTSDDRKSSHSSHSKDKRHDESTSKSSRMSGVEKSKYSDKSDIIGEKKDSKKASESKNKSKDNRDDKAAIVRRPRYSVIELTDSDECKADVSCKSKDSSRDGNKKRARETIKIKISNDKANEAKAADKRREEAKDMKELTEHRHRLLKELEKTAQDSDDDKRREPSKIRRSRSTVSEFEKISDDSDVLETVKPSKAKPKEKSKEVIRRSRSTVSDVEKISDDSDSVKTVKSAKKDKPKEKRHRIITDSSDEDDLPVPPKPTVKKTPAVVVQQANSSTDVATKVDLAKIAEPLSSVNETPKPVIDAAEAERQRLFEVIRLLDDAKLKKISEILSGATAEASTSIGNVVTKKADSPVQAAATSSQDQPQVATTPLVIKTMQMIAPPQPQSPTISSCERIDDPPQTPVQIEQVKAPVVPQRVPNRVGRPKKSTNGAGRPKPAPVTDEERVTSSPRVTRSKDDTTPIVTNKAASRFAKGRSKSVCAPAIGSPQGRRPTFNNQVSSPVVSSPKLQRDQLRVTSPALSSPELGKPNRFPSPKPVSPITIRINRDPRLMSPRLDRESPKTVKKRNKKSELEKLQEDINRNFALLDMMSLTSVRSAPKEVAIPAKPKKVIQRRKSMCSMSEENGSIKLTITREPAKAKPIMKRRQSMGAGLGAPFVKLSDIEDDIRNDDPYYDMESGNCRLCTKSSADMGRHYIQHHPKSEVYCCRIKYGTANKLVKGESVNVLVNGDSLQYNCIICETTQSCATYFDIYDHLVHHTAEFYHKCLQCDFRDVTINKEHGKKHKFEICPYPDVDKKRILGHMCDMCHYVQLSKKNITNHIMMQHRGQVPKPNCKEIVLLDFGEHNICTIDFEDLDDKFLEMSVIVPPEENWVNFEDVFRDYMNRSPITVQEATSTSVIGDRNENVCASTFEHDVYKMMAIAAPEVKTTNESRLGIRINNVKYNMITGIFQYSGDEGQYKNADYDKVLEFLTDLSAMGETWTGTCHECDEIGGTYSDPHPVHMELLHLRNVHWYRIGNRSVESIPQPIATKGNVLRPWLSTVNKKSKTCSERLLSISAILARFKCMAVDCHFFTNSIEVMASHLDEHDEDPMADDDDVIECPYCDASTTNPSDYLIHVVTEHGSCQYFCPYCFYRSNGGSVLHHLQIYHPERNPFMYDGKFDGVFVDKPEDRKAIYLSLVNNVHEYECQECNERFFPLDMYQKHLEGHGRGYFCQICDINVPAGHFMPHIADHDQGPFDCIYCPFGAKDGPTIKRHFIDNHPCEIPYVCVRFVSAENVDCYDLESIRLCPLVEHHVDSKFVKAVPKEVFEELKEKSPPNGGIAIAVAPPPREEVATDNDFDDFIKGLPEQFIFDTAINCPKCKYSNSVRKNLLRHLELHSTDPLLDQENEPVNRQDQIVAQVKKNQLAGAPKRALFEANLAENKSVAPIKRRRMTISEISGVDMEVPQYVPMADRFYCGVQGCVYKALEERMLKLHVDTIHAKETHFKCPHCAKELNGVEYDLDAIAMHYKLHDNQLFKCGQCAFYADTRHNMSKHVRKRHNHTVNEEDIQVVRSIQEAKLPPPKPTKTAMMRRNSIAGPQPKKKRARVMEVRYRCSYCPFTATLEDEMKWHAQDKHNYMGQFECSICGLIAMTPTGFKIHCSFKHKRPGVELPTMLTHFKIASDSSEDDEEEEERERVMQEREKENQQREKEKQEREKEKQEREKEKQEREKEKQEIEKEKQERERVMHEREEEKADEERRMKQAKVPLPKNAELLKRIEEAGVFHKSLKDHPVARPIVYYCELCPSTFEELDAIETHYRHNHGTCQFSPKMPNFLLFTCSFCKFVSAEAKALLDHFSIYHDKLPPVYRIEYMVKCVKCEYSSTAEKVGQHYAERHKDELPMVRSVHQAQSCGLCGYRYADEESLQTHYGEAHPIELANPVVKINGKLMRRLLNVKVDKKFKCRVCKEVLNKYQCRFHDHAQHCVAIEMAHRYKCRMCNFITLDYEQAKVHLGWHKEKNVSCKRCHLWFSTYDVLMMHITEHRQVADLMAELITKYSIEIVFPNGLVALESVAAGTLKASDYKHTAGGGVM